MFLSSLLRVEHRVTHMGLWFGLLALYATIFFSLALYAYSPQSARLSARRFAPSLAAQS